MITVYQINLTDEQIDSINLIGFDAVPEGHARITMQLGARKWKDEFAKFYTPVYEVDTDDLDDAFEITNLWENMDRVTRLKRGSSSSVGDIFVKDGNCYIVDNFGFVNVGKYDLGI
jgi:hypothetical protein